MSIRAIALFCGLFIACASQPQAPVSYRAYARGESNASRAIGAWSVTLTRAQLGIGPVYFCTAANTSTEGCDIALQELRKQVVIDALDSDAQSLGDVTGVTGVIRSGRYDLGVSWWLTDDAARSSDVAPDGHSLVLEGTATHTDARTFAFRAEVDITPQFAGSFAIAGQPMSADVQDDAHALTISVDPFEWIEGLDFEALHAVAEQPVRIAADYPVLDGGAVDPRARARETIAQSLTSAARPQFTWSEISP